MHTQWEIINTGPLLAQVKNSDLGVRDTTAEPTLGVGLVFTVPVTETKKKIYVTHGREALQIGGEGSKTQPISKGRLNIAI